MRRDRRGTITVVLLYVVCVVAALALSALLISVTGGPWRTVLSALLDGSIRRPGRWGDTLVEAAPLLIVALGAIVATKAGLVNIGQEGQVAVGAACAAFVATRHSGPVVVVLAIAVGFVGGAVWAAIAALLKFWRRVPEVITTLLLVFVAAQGTGYLLTRTFLLLDPDPNKPNRVQTSAQLDPDTRLGAIRMFGNQFSLVVPIALLLAIAFALVLSRSAWGFRLKMVGQNPRTAQRAGVSVVVAGAGALALSGAMAGFAGAAMLAAGSANHRYTPGFANNVGWEGLLVALVARNRPLAAMPIALVFGALRTGAGFLAATGVEREIVDVVRALLVLALLLPPAIMSLRRRRAETEAPAATPTSTSGDVITDRTVAGATA